MLPANFRVDAWVIPPLYTGKPPVMLPGIHPGENFAQLTTPVSVPVNSTLVMRATGKVESRHVRLRRRCRIQRAGGAACRQ